MADYTIINATASALADGVADTAAYTIDTGITLSAAELAVVVALDGVAVMQDAASAAEIAAVADLLIGGTGAEPGVSFKVANGSSGTVGGVAAYKLGEVTLTASELATALATAGVAVVAADTTDAGKATAGRVLELGKIPGHTTT